MRLIQTLIINKSDKLRIQMFRYVVVGGISFIIDYGLLYVLTELVGLHYLISSTLSFIAGLVVNYGISTHWVFSNSKLDNKTVEFIVYGIIGIVGLFFNNILMYLFTDVMHIYYMLSKLGAVVIVLMWNFFGRRTLLFNKKEDKV